MKNITLPDNLMLSYSSIISSEDYNHLMTNEHLYINTADKFIEKTITRKSTNKRLQVVELGCGPARVASFIAEIRNIDLTAVDIDPVFCEYARKIANQNKLALNVICSDIASYKHPQPVDIFYSQGFHHHVSKGKETKKYLSNIYNQLTDDGCYILSDEFVPEYTDANDRDIKLVIWYSHIIGHALSNNFKFLAVEEAKTLLDDLQEGHETHGLKSQEQLDLVLAYSKKINTEAKANNISQAEIYSKDFLKDLNKLFNLRPDQSDPSMNLSRRDYKICDKVLRTEAEQSGFIVDEVKSFGPIKNIGGMSVYILRK